MKRRKVCSIRILGLMKKRKSLLLIRATWSLKKYSKLIFRKTLWSLNQLLPLINFRRLWTRPLIIASNLRKSAINWFCSFRLQIRKPRDFWPRRAFWLQSRKISARARPRAKTQVWASLNKKSKLRLQKCDQRKKWDQKPRRRKLFLQGVLSEMKFMVGWTCP